MEIEGGFLVVVVVVVVVECNVEAGEEACDKEEGEKTEEEGEREDVGTGGLALETRGGMERIGALGGEDEAEEEEMGGGLTGACLEGTLRFWGLA